MIILPISINVNPIKIPSILTDNFLCDIYKNYIGHLSLNHISNDFFDLTSNYSIVLNNYLIGNKYLIYILFLLAITILLMIPLDRILNPHNDPAALRLEEYEKRKKRERKERERRDPIIQILKRQSYIEQDKTTHQQRDIYDITFPIGARLSNRMATELHLRAISLAYYNVKAPTRTEPRAKMYPKDTNHIGPRHRPVKAQDYLSAIGISWWK